MQYTICVCNRANLRLLTMTVYKTSYETPKILHKTQLQKVKMTLVKLNRTTISAVPVNIQKSAGSFMLLVCIIPDYMFLY